jgi:hypothetical protein
MEPMEAERLRPVAGKPLFIHHDVLRFLQPLELTLDGPVPSTIVSFNSYVLAPT